MDYPREFSPQARARVEAEQLKAVRLLEQQRHQVPWRKYGPNPQDAENLRRYILRVFLVFSKEACKLGMQGLWGADEVRQKSENFLRSFTIEAYLEQGHDKSGRKLSEMTGNWNGSLLPEVYRLFRESPEWHQFEDELLEVAEEFVAKEQSEKPVPIKRVTQAPPPVTVLSGTGSLISREETLPQPVPQPAGGVQQHGAQALPPSARSESPEKAKPSHVSLRLPDKLANAKVYPTVTLAEAMQALSVSRATIYRWVEEGKLRRAGGQHGKKAKLLISTASLIKAMEEPADI